MDARAAERGRVKCLVWDLDGTLWEGILLEGGARRLAEGARETIVELDRRGVLQSVASRNDHGPAWARLEELGLAEYFLHPQIGWHTKAESLRTIADRLGIGLDSLALVDDQPFERDEVGFYAPEVLTFDASDLGVLLEVPALRPRFVTPESRRRRAMYRADERRNDEEREFRGPRQEFLATLDMVMTIRPAGEADLERAEELTVRTNQLNTSGRTYSHDELRGLLRSPEHLVLVAELDDRYGASGTIGLALVETGATRWVVRLLLMSCRVVPRGVGTIMLTHVLHRAREAGVELVADFVPSDRNRRMYIAFKFMGFVETGVSDRGVTLRHPLDRLPSVPSYVTLRLPESRDDGGERHARGLSSTSPVGE